ncbi:bi-domain-containing oxidoreductase [Pseudomonas putida]|uniref:bi-domain-containing oxidoreductase n=1 Tax=Pseudomonas putida TaxID=303 RepID=UPI00236421FF|nr:bi-domain-containing oxidoreductase [Pseudomonas putida]MDD2053711.1 bi-domain-containing oxidoreductase [Pseudomonas putida]
MRQVLLASDRVRVARMPAPGVEPGAVLVHVQYSMISVGTEVAGLRPTAPSEASTGLDQAREITSRASRYLAKAIADPRLAASRLKRIAKNQIARLIPEPPKARLPDQELGAVAWERDAASEFVADNGRLLLLTDDSDWQYQAHTAVFQIPLGYQVAVELRGAIDSGKLAIGILDENGSKWLGNRTLTPGALDDRLIFDPQGEAAAKLVISNAQGGVTKADFERLHVVLVAPNPDGDPHNEMDETGWNLGYSAAGVVVAVGAGVQGLKVGDRVACGGAGRANHADYVLVPRNLVCPVPEGCDMRWAASATIGTIAMQGVRRAQPDLGEKVAVIGLGLLGLLTVQLLRAAGCQVIGFDLDPKRVERARELGMEHGTSNAAEFPRLIRDTTAGLGCDRTLITAATKSDGVINTAMEITRRRGVVVIVGDVGLNVQRAHFYRKEIDLLMSTSYGPGRYDASYEEKGNDYPISYVRWTLNRNMQSYMELIAAKRLDVESLVDIIAPVDEAPALYKTLANSQEPPIGVLLDYTRADNAVVEPAEAERIQLRGARSPQTGKINYLLVGAGAYGQSMLVPMLDRMGNIFLHGVVSRDAVRGGNFVRERRLGVFASNLNAAIDDPDVHMLVIATRHCEHAAQAIAGLNAGKHVFVEKPVAITWDELDALTECHDALENPPLLMVGFNRRFSPAIQALREVLAGRTAPLAINYRLNGGYIPLDHWIQTEQGGGRNIGEACHMYDVFRCLTGAAATSVSATGINPGGRPYLATDNFSATVGYADGSIGNLFYTALGPKQGLPKERIEVFCDGEAYVIDDFKQLIKASTGEVLWSACEADKGQGTQMKLLAEALASGGPAPIPFDEIIETTAVSLRVEELLTGVAAIHVDT